MVWFDDDAIVEDVFFLWFHMMLVYQLGVGKAILRGEGFLFGEVGERELGRVRRLLCGLRNRERVRELAESEAISRTTFKCMRSCEAIWAEAFVKSRSLIHVVM